MKCSSDYQIPTSANLLVLRQEYSYSICSDKAHKAKHNLLYIAINTLYYNIRFNH